MSRIIPNNSRLIGIIIALLLLLIWIHIQSSKTQVKEEEVFETNNVIEPLLDTKESIEVNLEAEEKTSSIEKNWEIPPYLEPLANKNLGPPGKSPAEEELERIWNFVYNRQYYCSEHENLGGKGHDNDGAFDLCIEKRFWPKLYVKKYRCLVYSFETATDFTFEDEMAKRGCKVHTFDPGNGMKDLNVRSSGVIYHKIGYSSVDKEKKGIKLRTIKTLLKDLQHFDNYLDYLKVDIESYIDGGLEDYVLRELLETGLFKCVRQFAMVMHMPGIFTGKSALEKYRNMYMQMSKLSVGGWRLYNTTENIRENLRLNRNYSMRKAKQEQLEGKSTLMKWEVVFVNLKVEGKCGKYLNV